MNIPSRQDHDHGTHAHHHPAPVPPTEGLKDPVCGMSVTPNSDHRAEHAGRPYYF